MPKSERSVVNDGIKEMIEAVGVRDYQRLAAIGAERGLFYLKSQERRKEPGFMPELFLFGEGLKVVCALPDVTIFTSYTSSNGSLCENYGILPNVIEAVWAGGTPVLDGKKPEIALLVGSAWTKTLHAKTMEEVAGSPRHGAIVAFANVYLEPEKPIATHAALFSSWKRTAAVCEAA
jgi:hypothetical protein